MAYSVLSANNPCASSHSVYCSNAQLIGERVMLDLTCVIQLLNEPWGEIVLSINQLHFQPQTETLSKTLKVEMAPRLCRHNLVFKDRSQKCFKAGVKSILPSYGSLDQVTRNAKLFTDDRKSLLKATLISLKGKKKSSTAIPTEQKPKTETVPRNRSAGL